MQLKKQPITYGGIVGTQNEEKTTVTNCYYLSGTYGGAINGQDTDGQNQKKTDEEMKKEDFVSTLNNENKEPVWVKDEKYTNNGYPVLK